MVVEELDENEIDIEEEIDEKTTIQEYKEAILAYNTESNLNKDFTKSDFIINSDVASFMMFGKIGLPSGNRLNN